MRFEPFGHDADGVPLGRGNVVESVLIVLSHAEHITQIENLAFVDRLLLSAQFALENLIGANACIAHGRLHYFVACGGYDQISLVCFYCEFGNVDRGVRGWRYLELKYQLLHDARVEHVHRARLSDVGELRFSDVWQGNASVRRASFEMQLNTIGFALLEGA